MISIITINYNNSEGLKRTLKSVSIQDESLYELIVIDGGSNDRSLEIINAFNHIIDYKRIGPDLGIYDAMNKGLERCSQDFVMFLNSGDIFINKDCISTIKNFNLSSENAYFFNAIIKSKEINYSKKSPKNFQSTSYQINHKFIPNHQAILFNIHFYKNNSYNLTYKISSDVDYIFRLSKSNNLLYIDYDLVEFELGGVSSTYKSFKKTFIHMKEALKINLRYQKNYLYCLIRIPLKFLIKYLLQNLIGNRFYFLVYNIKRILK